MAYEQHHFQSGGRRVSDETIPLCHRCHKAVTNNEKWALYILKRALELRGIKPNKKYAQFEEKS